MGKSVSFTISRPRAVDDHKSESSQLLSLTGLSAAKLLRRYKVLERFVVSKDLYRAFATRVRELRPLFLKGLDNCEHFLVVDSVITLGRAQASRIEGYWV